MRNSGKNIIGKKINIPRFCQKNGIKYLGLFGSYARGDYSKDSDIDLLYEFEKGKIKSLFGLADIQISLEKKLGKKVDLVGRNYIKERLKPYIYEDLLTIYEKR
ncbi:MAG: nucleotidyltransferase domain-containing protein [Patescibacteria group bacterium]|nr:nucleotidyltransferase domain-containing protein [Patescibacteria group bacterium]